MKKLNIILIAYVRLCFELMNFLLNKKIKIKTAITKSNDYLNSNYCDIIFFYIQSYTREKSFVLLLIQKR
jgi:hypothetical protein